MKRAKNFSFVTLRKRENDKIELFRTDMEEHNEKENLLIVRRKIR